MKGYEIYLDKLVLDNIEAKCSLTDILFGIKELSGKLDILISLKEVELGRQQLRQERQSQNFCEEEMPMEPNEDNHITLHTHIDTSELDETIKKAERLNELLNEASSLANELASKEIKLSVEVES